MPPRAPLFKPQKRTTGEEEEQEGVGVWKCFAPNPPRKEDEEDEEKKDRAEEDDFKRVRIIIIVVSEEDSDDELILLRLCVLKLFVE